MKADTAPAHTLVRPGIARCLALAQRRAAEGNAEAARELVKLALDIAVPEEIATVLTTADQILIGSSPSARTPAGAAPAPGQRLAPTTVPLPAAPAAPAPEPRQPVSGPVRSAPAGAGARASAPARGGTGMARPLLAAAFAGALLWGAVSLVRPGRVESPQGMLRRGQALLADGDTAAALKLLRESASSDAAEDGPGQQARLLLRALGRS